MKTAISMPDSLFAAAERVGKRTDSAEFGTGLPKARGGGPIGCVQS